MDLKTIKEPIPVYHCDIKQDPIKLNISDVFQSIATIHLVGYMCMVYVHICIIQVVTNLHKLGLVEIFQLLEG